MQTELQGKIYDGIWEEGNLVKGFVDEKNNWTYEGEWRDGQANGFGKLVRFPFFI